MSRTVAVWLLLSVVMFAVPSNVFSAGGVGVGITEPADTLYASSGTYCSHTTSCAFPNIDCETAGGGHPDFTQAPLPTVPGHVVVDLDILVSQSFVALGAPLSDPDIDLLATRIADNAGNSPLPPPEYHYFDLRTVFNYYTIGDTLYGDFQRPTYPEGNFYFHHNMLNDTYVDDAESNRERSHVDVYLSPGALNEQGVASTVEITPTSCVIPPDPCTMATMNCCYPHGGGSVKPFFLDDDEDPPFSLAEQGGNCKPEYCRNGLSINDHGGKVCDIADWQLASAVTYTHELEHQVSLEQIPGYTGGTPFLEEFFATTAEYLAGAAYPPGINPNARFDVCYDQAFPLLTNNYQIWRTWGVYLLQQFQNDPGIEDDLVRKWNRWSGNGSRTMLTLAQALEDPDYDALGCVTCPTGFKGQYRIQNLNNLISVARWVDEPYFLDPNGEGKYGYRYTFSPALDIGIFRKVAPGIPGAPGHCDWSHTVPPVKTMGSANLNNKTTVTCYVDPRDPPGCNDPVCGTQRGFCGYGTDPEPYCNLSAGCGDPVDVLPWAADVIGFVAGPEFDGLQYNELKVDFNFQAVPNPYRYRFFINVITYNVADADNLWNQGRFVTSITSYGPYSASSAHLMQFTLGDFGCSMIKSVAFVVSAADSVSLRPIPVGGPRLDYSYGYQVTNPILGPHMCPLANPTCPFLYVEGTGGFLRDNSILAEGAYYAGNVPSEPDVRDDYVLSRPVEVRDGRVVLELREESDALSHLDAMQLLAYDVPAGAEVARLVQGSTVGLAMGAHGIDGVRDRNGLDVAALLASEDGQVVVGDAGDYVEFEWLNSVGAWLEIIVVNPTFKQPPPGGWGSLAAEEGNGIVLQAQVGDRWIDLGSVEPRERGENLGFDTSTIPGTPGDVIRLRLLWRNHHELDWLALAQWTALEGTPLPLLQATHSVQGDVSANLLAVDGRNAMLGMGESIRLNYDATLPLEGRRLSLVSHGYYVISQGFASGNAFQPSIALEDEIRNRSLGNRVSAFPNPSRGSAVLAIELSTGGDGEIAVYSIDGRLVRRLHTGTLGPGAHEVVWDGRNSAGRPVSAGQYFYRVEVGSSVETGKIFIIR